MQGIQEMTLATTNKTLLVVTGPTAVGKTEISTQVAKSLDTHILSADARQFYRELKIGTAFPDDSTLAAVPHHFTGHLSIGDYYNVSMFEQEALKLLDGLFSKHDYVVLTGGSGMYLDTLCHGIDDMPDPDQLVRQQTLDLYQKEGINGLRHMLRQLDPGYYEMVDKANPKRLMRGIEVYLATGKTFSSYRQSTKKERPFRIRRMVLNRPRAELFERINTRVDMMIRDGLIEEALRFYRYRHLNALNTVGYKELYAWIANTWNLSTAIEKIKTNTRRYAKRQLTWFAGYSDAAWFHPDDFQQIMHWIERDNA